MCLSPFASVENGWSGHTHGMLIIIQDVESTFYRSSALTRCSGKIPPFVTIAVYEMLRVCALHAHAPYVLHQWHLLVHLQQVLCMEFLPSMPRI
jgi:hypothetical protein